MANYPYQAYAQRVKVTPLLSLALLATLPARAAAQVTIHEVCASNIDLVNDEDGKSSDWIELWNHGAEEIDLTGWHLSDDPDELEAWTLPPLSIPPQQGALIWASGRGTDRPVGPHYHTFVRQGSPGRYFAVNTEPPASWRDLNFDDSSWREGASGFGFGDDDDATVVNRDTIYVRQRFKIERKLARNLSALFLHVDYDDGYIAYLNGHEIARENMPGLPGTHVPVGTPASGSHEALLYQGSRLPSQQLTSFESFLRAGENVLSVQVHNESSASDDLSVSMFLTGMTASPIGESPDPALEFKGIGDEYALHTNFKLSASGEVIVLSDAAGREVDRLSLPQVYANTSYGRSDISGVGAAPLHFLEPTPGSPNTSEGRPDYAPSVSASPDGMMSSTALTVSLSSDDPAVDIRYSLDCTEPTEQSTLYAGAIPVSAQGATVIRARAFSPGLWPSPICTNTYLVDAAPVGELPIFSLVTEPDNLFDPDTGIYVLGPNAAGGPWFDGANFWNDWERPLHIEFFEEDGERELSMDVGTKIHGGFSRTLPQKSLRLMARGGYGDADMDYAFFEDLDNDEFESVVLRNSGNDFYFGLCRDPIVHIASEGTGLDDMAYRPTIVYLNGDYWGLMSIRERQDEDYLAYRHGVDPDKVDLLEHNLGVIEGSADHYQEMLDYLRDNDMSDDTHFDVIASMVDVDNYAHYFTHQIWANNTDWPQNNMKFWRAQEDGAKWRWLLYDTDFGLGLFGGPVTANALTRLFNPTLGSVYARELFLELMENEGFKRDFILRYADLLNTSLSPSALLPVVDEVEAKIIQDFPNHVPLWNGSFSFWQSHIGIIRDFITNRPDFCRDHIRFQFQLAGMYDLSLNVSPPGAGRVRLKVAEIDGPFTGTYFLGVPVQLEAIPSSGFSFTSWSDPSAPQRPVIQIDPAGAYSITAQFTGASGGASVVLNELQYNPSRSSDPGDWVELYNPTTTALSLDGWELQDESSVYQIPAGTVIPAAGHLVICRDLAAFSAEFPSVSNVLGGFGFGLSGAGERIELHAPNGLHDFVEYDDQAPWPTGPDGGGTTLELIDAARDNALPSSWAESFVQGGTPGQRNSVSP